MILQIGPFMKLSSSPLRVSFQAQIAAFSNQLTSSRTPAGPRRRMIFVFFLPFCRLIIFLVYFPIYLFQQVLIPKFSVPIVSHSLCRFAFC